MLNIKLTVEIAQEFCTAVLSIWCNWLP